MEIDERQQPAERRRGPDFWLRSIRWISVIGWMVLLLSLALIDDAKPQFETFFDRLFDIRMRLTWKDDLARSASILFSIAFGLSVLGLGINRFRHRRRDDELRLNFFVLAIFAAVGILCYQIYF